MLPPPCFHIAGFPSAPKVTNSILSQGLPSCGCLSLIAVPPHLSVAGSRESEQLRESNRPAIHQFEEGEGAQEVSTV